MSRLPAISDQEARFNELSSRLHALTPSERAEYERLDNARSLRLRRIPQRIARLRRELARLEAL